MLGKWQNEFELSSSCIGDILLYKQLLFILTHSYCILKHFFSKSLFWELSILKLKIHPKAYILIIFL